MGVITTTVLAALAAKGIHDKGEAAEKADPYGLNMEQSSTLGNFWSVIKPMLPLLAANSGVLGGGGSSGGGGGVNPVFDALPPGTGGNAAFAEQWGALAPGAKGLAAPSMELIKSGSSVAAADKAWKAAAVTGGFQLGAALLQYRASGNAERAGTAAAMAQEKFVREQWEKQQGRDDVALAQEKERYEADEAREAPYRSISDSIARQQAERLGLPAPPPSGAAARPSARQPSPYVPDGPLDFLESTADPTSYLKPNPQTIGDLSRLSSLQGGGPPPSQQRQLTLEDLMRMARGSGGAFGSVGAFGRRRT